MSEKKIRLGFFNSYSLWGGGEKWNIEMMEKLGLNNHQCALFAPPKGELTKRVLGKKLAEHYPIEVSKYSYFNPFHIIHFYKTFKKNPVDVLIFNSFVDVRAAALAAKLAGIKTTLMRVGTPIAPKEKLSYRLSFSYGLDDIAVISEEIKKVFITNAPRLVKGMSLPLFYNGIDVDSFHMNNHTPSTPITFGNCSRLTEQKGFHYLIEAAEKIKHKKFKILIAGDGESKDELQGLVREKKIEHIIQFLGHFEEPQRFYQDIDVLSFTSSFEGTARTILEAWGSGLPVISFNISSMGDMISHGEDGVLVKPFDTDEYAKVLESIIDNFDSYREMGKKGRLKVEKEFNKKKQYEKWYNYLVSL